MKQAIYINGHTEVKQKITIIKEINSLNELFYISSNNVIYPAHDVEIINKFN